MFSRLRPFSVLIFLHLLIIGFAAWFLLKQKGEPAPAKEKIAVVNIDGIISDDHDGISRGQSVDSIVHAIQDYRDDDDVKAMVLQINSPGGSVGSVQEIYSAVKKFRGKGKFVVSSFGDVAASGGYYVACAGTKIVSQPGTLTGSIGVIMEMPNVQGLMEKLGVNIMAFKSGAMKDSGSPFRPITQNEVDYFNQVVGDAYGQFYAAVKEGRQLDDATLKPLADGRVFSGRDAMQKKLVDQLGDMEDAVEMAKDLAGLKDKKPEIIYFRERPTLERLLDLVSRSPVKDLTALATGSKAKLMYVME